VKRAVVGLRAARLARGPGWKPSRVRGLKAKGLAFERKVLKQLKEFFGFAFEPGPWIQFEDANGAGFAQPDGVIAFLTHMVLIEVKLSETPSAAQELRGLYAPLVRKIWKKPVALLQVFKYCGKSDIEFPVEILTLRPNATEVYTWHCL